ncbi:MAG: hypothetical protein JSS36_03240 [Proteobacteria bacterium]|nr:hypothetical protein [Pseudomonadota bacterium]
MAKVNVTIKVSAGAQVHRWHVWLTQGNDEIDLDFAGNTTATVQLEEDAHYDLQWFFAGPVGQSLKLAVKQGSTALLDPAPNHKLTDDDLDDAQSGGKYMQWVNQFVTNAAEA